MMFSSESWDIVNSPAMSGGKTKKTQKHTISVFQFSAWYSVYYSPKT